MSIVCKKKRDHNVSLSPVRQIRTAFVKPEDVVRRPSPSSSLKLNSAEKEVYWKLPKGVKSGFKVYEVSFWELLDEVARAGEETRKEIEAGIWDLPYNTWWVAASGNFKCEWLCLKDVRFCSALQSKTWYELLIGEIEDMVESTKREELMMSDDLFTQESTIFKGEAKAFYHVRDPGFYYSDLRRKFLQHIYVAYRAFFFGSRSSQALRCSCVWTIMHDRTY